MVSCLLNYANNKNVVDELTKKYPDVDPFLMNKWERIFTLFFDRNCSNDIDKGDFYLIAKRVREVYGEQSVQMLYAEKTLKALWKGLCKAADANRDNLISLDEWIRLLKSVNVQEKLPPWLEKYEKFMFKLFDVSGDGFLDQAEYADGMSLYGFKYKECLNTFTLFAFDEQGKPIQSISPVQWKSMFLDLFFSRDRSKPGNNLFGKNVNVDCKSNGQTKVDNTNKKRSTNSSTGQNQLAMTSLHFYASKVFVCQ
ncbi:Calcium-binding protein [Aphelenchoides besseyi]|nr:Calcium-binding protein [Aphelenchoides besseyi]